MQTTMVFGETPNTARQRRALPFQLNRSGYGDEAQLPPGLIDKYELVRGEQRLGKLRPGVELQHRFPRSGKVAFGVPIAFARQKSHPRRPIEAVETVVTQAIHDKIQALAGLNEVRSRARLLPSRLHF